MNTNEITLAKSWELIGKEDNNSKDINWQDTQQVMDTFGLSNWNVSVEEVSKVVTKSLVAGTNQVLEQSWTIPKGQNNDRVVVVRKDTGTGLAFRTSQYTPVQNE